MENNELKEDEQVPLSKVKLNREWAVWENYDTKKDAPKIDYSKSLKEIFSFDTIIDFWQFWNLYPGATPEKLFYDGDCTK
ncbi:MAG: eukaryotic translation initiation factor EIF4E family protein [archaeon]|nr:eukaryotic translation initiation factor EIF4E family protein [archaeon]